MSKEIVVCNTCGDECQQGYTYITVDHIPTDIQCFECSMYDETSWLLGGSNEAAQTCSNKQAIETTRTVSKEIRY